MSQSPFPLAAHTDAVRDATERLQAAKSEADGYGPGQGADAGAIQIGHQDGQVLIVFDKPVGYASVTPEAAVEMAAQLLNTAKAAGFGPAVGMWVDPGTDQARMPVEPPVDTEGGEV